jgi:hypothetical protein
LLKFFYHNKIKSTTIFFYYFQYLVFLLSTLGPINVKKIQLSFNWLVFGIKPFLFFSLVLSFYFFYICHYGILFMHDNLKNQDLYTLYAKLKQLLQKRAIFSISVFLMSKVGNKEVFVCMFRPTLWSLLLEICFIRK